MTGTPRKNNVKFATCYGRKVRILREKNYYGNATLVLVKSLEEPFYSEYSTRGDRTYGKYERSIWVDKSRLENIYTDRIDRAEKD